VGKIQKQRNVEAGDAGHDRFPISDFGFRISDWLATVVIIGMLDLPGGWAGIRNP